MWSLGVEGAPEGLGGWVTGGHGGRGSLKLSAWLREGLMLFPHVPALCDMHPMRALFLIPRNPPPRLKSKKW